MRTLRLGITAQSQAERSLGPSLANQPSIYAGDSCDASRQPLTLLQRNDTTGLYDVMRTVSEEEYADHQDNRQVIKNQNRQLFASFEENVLGAPLFTTTSTSDRNGHYRHLQGLSVSRNDNDPDAMLLGRACPCSPVEGTYCPVGQYNCRIAFANAYRERVEVTCTAQGQDFFLRYVFPLTIFMFLFFGCLCFCSPKGKYSMGYMKKLVCCWNDERYEQYLNEALDRMAQLQYTRQMRLDRLRAYQASSRRVAMPRERYMLPGSAREASPTDTAGIAVARQSVVVLKTMKYEDVVRRELGKEQEEEMCAICLNVFQEGDRVGNVRCGHVFHVLCLKTWIKRKNHCPLCQMNDLATPQEDPEHGSAPKADEDGIDNVDDASEGETSPMSQTESERSRIDSVGSAPSANSAEDGSVGHTAVTGLEG